MHLNKSNENLNIRISSKVEIIKSNKVLIIFKKVVKFVWLEVFCNFCCGRL